MAKPDVVKRLGARIRDLRGRADLTQEGLAERAGITWHFVSAIERGTKGATVETLAAVAAALGISLSELFLDVDRSLPRDVERLQTALAGKPLETQRGILRIVDEAMALAGTSQEPARPATRSRR